MDTNLIARIQQLESEKKIFVQALENVIKSTVHPNVAVRAVMVDLKPIRNVLKNIVGSLPELGIK